MANNLNLSELLTNPEFEKQFREGFQKGSALARTIAQTPMQPEVTAEEIQPEPEYVQPSTTTYSGVTEPAPQEQSIYDKMMAAQGGKQQQELLYKLMSQSMQQQEAGVKQAQEALRKEQERQAKMSVLEKLDIRPFAEALRSYGSTSVAPGQAPEMTELQRQELLRRMQSQVQSAQEGMTKEQVAALRTMMQDKAAAQAQLSTRNAMFRETKEVTSQLYKLGSAAQEYNKDANLIEGIVNQKKIPVRKLTMIVTKLGRSLGEVGAQTNTDRLSYYTPTFEAQLMNIATRFGSDGTVDMNDPSIKAIREVVSEAKSEAANALKNKAGLYREMMSAEGSPTAYLFQPGKAGDVGYKKIIDISNATLMGKKEKQPEKEISIKPKSTNAEVISNVPSDKDINSMTPEQLKKYLGM